MPLGKLQHNIKISIKTARVSRPSVSYDYDLSGFYLRRNLKKHVDIIKYINVNDLLYVYSKNYSVEELISEYINLSKKIECLAKELDQPMTTQNIIKCGPQVKKEIK